ncbi:MAG: hypothetical protein IH972_03835 [Candidatus Marinimicrobia bacterium]|nr:hypothetical protein [Candidatus Neomarinimicrobiota bacterium]
MELEHMGNYRIAGLPDDMGCDFWKSGGEALGEGCHEPCASLRINSDEGSQVSYMVYV